MKETTAREFTGSCPRCGGSLVPTGGGQGVCLACAGARVLGFDQEPGDPLAGGLGPDWLPPDPLEFAADLPATIGDCEIIEELGRGGMGRVFAARQKGLGRIVAIKAIAAGPAAASELERRFLREAQTIARLRHPHIVAVHEFGRSNGFAYFTMDYIEGGDLARHAKAHPFSPREAAALVHKVAGALAYTHAEGVLHRDLKPSNILLDAGEPRVADFGLAAQLEPGGDLTAASGVLGTPHYLAPEALRGGSAAQGIAGDIYALGVILFELCTGRAPYAGASPAELTVNVMTTEAPSPRLLAPATPTDLETICLKCLERDPARRYASMAALAEDLRRFLGGEPILARPIHGVARFTRWCRRRPALAAVWMLITALAIGSTAAATWINRERTRAEAALGAARLAEGAARERLRDARLAEARAMRRTLVPGRRDQALAALAEAARIRPGSDLRDEALAALLIPDIRDVEHWMLGHGVPGEVNFDPAGTWVTFEERGATGFGRGPAEIRRWGEAKPFGTLAVPDTAALGRLDFSPDGRWVMGRYRDASLRVWRVGEGAPVVSLRDRPSPGGDDGGEFSNDDYDFSPDSTQFALGLPEGGVALYRTADGTELARWPGKVRFHTVRYSPDGRHLAAAVLVNAGAGPALFVMATADGRIEHALTPEDAIGSVEWSPDSRLVAVALRGNLVVTYDTRDGRMLQKFSSVARNPRDLVYLGGETLLAVRASGTTTMHFLNAVRGEDEVQLDNIGASFITAQPGGKTFVVADNAGRVTRWEVLAPAGFRTVPPPRPAGYEGIGDAGALDFSPDGRWEVTSSVGIAIIRDTRTGRLAGEIDDHVSDMSDISTAVFTADARGLVQCSPRRGLRRTALSWTSEETCAGGELEVLDAEKGFVIAAYTEDRRRFALIDYRTGHLKVVDVDQAGARTVSRWKVPGVYNVAFDPEGRRLLVNCTGMGSKAAEQRLRVHDAATGEVVKDLGPVVSCDAAWSRDGRTALTSHGQEESILWNASTWQPIATLRGELGGNMTTFAFSPDGSYAIVARDQGIHLVSTKDGSRIASMAIPSAPGLSAAIKFVPNTRSFAVLWRDGRLDYFDPETLRTELKAIGLEW